MTLTNPAPQTLADIFEIRRDGSRSVVSREWVPEVPVALEFNGLAYAVMMATPTDLEDFARGFALTEGLAASAHDVTSIAVAKVELGFIIRTSLEGVGVEQLSERVRTRVAESSCGLCGIENLEALAKALPKVSTHDPIRPDAVFAGIASLRERQTLNKRTHAAHGAAFCDPSGQILVMREDVGRHNAIDKLVGAAAVASFDPADGFFVSTARCSYEIVEKVVKAGGTSLVTVSLPTTMAVDRATDAGLSLYCLARDDSFLDLGADTKSID